MILAWIRLILGGFLILLGLFVEILAVAGVYRLSYILNRMHLAALGDTLGLLCVLTGLMIFSGFTVMTVKLILVLVFFWLTSPISGHMLTKAELTTNPDAEKEFEVTEP